MTAIFWRTLRDNKRTLLIYVFSGIVFLWIFVAFYPSVAKSSTEVSQLIKSLPEPFIEAFGLDPKTFTTFEGFIAGKYYSLIWPIIIAALAISLSSSFLAGEIEKGSIDVMLSMPISRVKIFLAKLSAGIFTVALFAAVSVLSVFPLVKFYNLSFMGENHIKLALVGLFLGLAVFALSMFASSIFSERGKVIGITLFVFLSMYVLNIIALIKDNLSDLKYLSFFYYFNYNDVLLNGKTLPESWYVFGGTILAASIAGISWFNRRDVMI